MNDKTIPFIREYGEWAILAAVRGTARAWRQLRYQDHTIVVPESKRYLAENSRKRNPNAPRGARFSVRSSKRDQMSTLDDNDSDDRRVPVLPPGPSTPANLVGFSDGETDWDTGPSPDHPIPGPSQLPFSGSFSKSTSTPWTNMYGLTVPQNYPQSGPSAGADHSSTGACVSLTSNSHAINAPYH